MQYIANSNLVLKAVDSAQQEVDISTETAATITLSKDAKSSAGGDPLVVQITISILAVSTTAITNGDGKSTVPGVITGNATKCNCKSSNKPVLLAGENYLTDNPAKCTIAITGSAGSSTGITDTLTVWVSEAGQEVAQGV